jgi:protoporphyrinogen oxidase
MNDTPIGIVGAGFAGLVAADELTRRGIPVEIYESGPSVGGLGRSFTDDEGFTLDFGAHFITNRLAAALGVSARCRTVRQYGESVFLDGRVRSYPYGLMRHPGFVLSAIKSRISRPSPTRSAADVFRHDYGEALSRHVAEPLLEAWSGAPASDLSPAVADKLSTSLPRTLWLRTAARLTHRAVAIGYCREQPESAGVFHVYPEDGIGTLAEHLATRVAGSIRLNSPVEAIVTEDGKVRSIVAGGEERRVRAAISTAPVTVLPKLVQGTDELSHLARFRYRPMVFVNLRMEGRDLLPNVVTWTPEDRFPFFRLTEAPRSMPWLAPPGKTVITADIGCEVGDPMWDADEDTLAARCVAAMMPIVPDAADRFLGFRVMRTPLAYPVFHLAYEEERREWAGGSGIDGLVSIGRNGEFDHLLMEDLYWRTLRHVHELLRAG